jgi:hypothetical protein
MDTASDDEAETNARLHRAHATDLRTALRWIDLTAGKTSESKDPGSKGLGLGK